MEGVRVTIMDSGQADRSQRSEASENDDDGGVGGNNDGVAEMEPSVVAVAAVVTVLEMSRFRGVGGIVGECVLKTWRRVLARYLGLSWISWSF
jgi:hypothetical protein